MLGAALVSVLQEPREERKEQQKEVGEVMGANQEGPVGPGRALAFNI